MKQHLPTVFLVSIVVISLIALVVATVMIWKEAKESNFSHEPLLTRPSSR